MTKNNDILILVADDDDDDFMLTKDALEEVKLKNNIERVVNGEELLNFLQKKGEYSSNSYDKQKMIILLDLNMPKVDGREALKKIKEDKNLRKIPIIVLTTSKAEEDVIKSYDLGVNSFIRKPVTFEQMVNVVKSFTNYWLQIVELP